MSDRRRTAVTSAVIALCGGTALAGPPYVSDDPEPTEEGHWEIYHFAAGTHAPGATAGQAGFDINYGGAENLQLTGVVPLDFDSRGPVGIGDVQLAAKYRFLHQTDDGWMPDVAFFPRFFVPNSGHQFGPERGGWLLPLWAEKDLGEWSLFGGGGYDINPGPGNRNFWLSGIAVSRALGETVSLGAEVYRQTPGLAGARTLTGVNLGATWVFTEHWSLIGSAGPGVQNARREGEYDFYVALEARY